MELQRQAKVPEISPPTTWSLINRQVYFTEHLLSLKDLHISFALHVQELPTWVRLPPSGYAPRVGTPLFVKSVESLCDLAVRMQLYNPGISIVD